MSRQLTFLLITFITLAMGVIGVGLGSSGWIAPWHSSADTSAISILWDLRIPRTAGAWLVGALLGFSGALAQGIFRNPLADPSLLGSSSGAGLGVALFLVIGTRLTPLNSITPLSQIWQIIGAPGSAFIGALAAVCFTLLLAKKELSTHRLLLAGIITSMVLSAATQAVVMCAPNDWRSFQTFLWGQTSLLSWTSVYIMTPVMVVGLLIALMFARVLDVMTLGESTAQSLGLPVSCWRMILITCMTLATGVAVSQAGLIAFVGLLAPHIARHLRSPCLYREHMIIASLCGGLLLLVSDVIARVILMPLDVPVGLLTALCGGGYMLWLMYRRPV